jgi:hypothetical protein
LETPSSETGTCTSNLREKARAHTGTLAPLSACPLQLPVHFQYTTGFHTEIQSDKVSVRNFSATETENHTGRLAFKRHPSPDADFQSSLDIVPVGVERAPSTLPTRCVRSSPIRPTACPSFRPWPATAGPRLGALRLATTCSRRYSEGLPVGFSVVASGGANRGETLESGPRHTEHQQTIVSRYAAASLRSSCSPTHPGLTRRKEQPEHFVFGSLPSAGSGPSGPPNNNVKPTKQDPTVTFARPPGSLGQFFCWFQVARKEWGNDSGPISNGGLKSPVPVQGPQSPSGPPTKDSTNSESRASRSFIYT